MKWIGIAGSWRRTNAAIEAKVRKIVTKIITDGNGIVSGGALGVDYFALDEAMKRDPSCQKIKIFLPATISVYQKRLYKRAAEKVITHQQANMLITQLIGLKQINPSALLENKEVAKIGKKAYYARIKNIVDASDALIAFHVNKSEGVQYTIAMAEKRSIPIKVYKYFSKS